MVGGGITEKPDGQMVALLRDAHATRDALMTGRDDTIDAMGQRLSVKRDYLSAHMRVTYLAPDIVRAARWLQRSLRGLRSRRRRPSRHLWPSARGSILCHHSRSNFIALGRHQLLRGVTSTSTDIA